jgi:hypothetical protein
MNALTMMTLQAAAKNLKLLRSKYTLGEAFTPSLVSSVNPMDQYTIDTYAEG